MIDYVIARVWANDDEARAYLNGANDLPSLGIWQLPGDDGAEVYMFSDETEQELLDAGWKKGPRTD